MLTASTGGFGPGAICSCSMPVTRDIMAAGFGPATALATDGPGCGDDSDDRTAVVVTGTWMEVASEVAVEVEVDPVMVPVVLGS